MKTLLLLLVLNLAYSSTTLEDWIENQLNHLDSGGVEIQFNYKIVTPWDSLKSSGEMVLWKKEQFRLDLGNRIVVSDGKIQKIYDPRSNQLFIDIPDTNIENSVKYFLDIRTFEEQISLTKVKDEKYHLKLLKKYNMQLELKYSQINSILEAISYKFEDKLFQITDINVYPIKTYPKDKLHLDVSQAFILDLRN